jgi:hypothetical protein
VIFSFRKYSFLFTSFKIFLFLIVTVLIKLFKVINFIHTIEYFSFIFVFPCQCGCQVCFATLEVLGVVIAGNDYMSKIK